MSALGIFLWVTVKMSRGNILLVRKLAQIRMCNTTLTSVYIIALYLCFFFNFHKLLLSTNEKLYLQKQPLVGTLQKIFYSIMITAGNYLVFVVHFYSNFGVFPFWGKGKFNHLQALNTSAKF